MWSYFCFFCLIWTDLLVAQYERRQNYEEEQAQTPNKTGKHTHKQNNEAHGNTKLQTQEQN